MVTIEFAAPPDIGRIMELWRKHRDLVANDPTTAAAYPFPKGSEEKTRSQYSKDYIPLKRILVAKKDAEIIGYCGFEESVGDKPGRIDTLFVEETFRGNRKEPVGSKLIAQAIVELERRGASKIEVKTHALNDKAIRAYERHGFVLSRNEGRKVILQRNVK